MLRTAAILALLATPALAEGPGPYTVTGTEPDGKTYTGTALLKQTAKGAWSITWRIGKDSFTGYGVGPASNLAIAFSGAGTRGVIAFTAQPDGRYTGTWIYAGGKSTGTEDLIPKP